MFRCSTLELPPNQRAFHFETHDALGQTQIKAFSHPNRILGGPLQSDTLPIPASSTSRATRSLPVLSKIFTRPSPERLDYALSSRFEVPLTSEELSVIHAFEQGASVCQWVGESFLCLGFCVMFGTLVILSWTEQKGAIALLITVLLSLLVMIVIGVFWKAATSHMNLLIHYRHQSKTRSRDCSLSPSELV
jgi:hypothetical protein